MKKLLLMFMVVVGVVLSNPYKDVTKSGVFVKAFSDEGGVGFVVVDEYEILLITSLNVGYNENGVRPVLITYGSNQKILCDATHLRTLDDGKSIYTIDNDYNIISILKRSPNVTVMILNSKYGGEDELWGQTIPLSGFTKLYNLVFK